VTVARALLPAALSNLLFPSQSRARKQAGRRRKEIPRPARNDSRVLQRVEFKLPVSALGEYRMPARLVDKCEIPHESFCDS
jgi:hypothetical protein